MAKVSFTAARVNGHTCPAGKSQAFLWDSKATGLGLRATAAGAKAYIFQGKIHGKTVRVTIGDPRNWGIDDAQEEARRLQRLVDKGIDPRERRAEEQASHAARQAERLRQDTTVKDAWQEYVRYLRTKTASKSKRPRSERYINEHSSYASPGGEPKKRGKGKTVDLHGILTHPA